MRKIFVAQIVKFLVLYSVLRTFESIVRRTLFHNSDVQKSSVIRDDTKTERKIDPDDEIKIIAVHYLGKAYKNGENHTLYYVILLNPII